MSKVFVKLKDTGSIFHDASQDGTVTGDKVVELKKTPKVMAAIKGGVLVEAKASEVEKTEEAKTEETKPAAQAPKK